MNSRLTEREMLNLLLRLLARTTPHGTEQTLAPLLPKGGTWDTAGNYIVEIGPGSQTMFAAHLDTVCTSRMKTRAIYNNGMVYSKKKRCPIGADDKAGVLCLIAMIHAGIPGTYIFHAGEECGGIGSSHIAGTMELSRFKRAVAFDRRGTSSVITSMGWGTSCSDMFAKALCTQLGMGFQPDPTGIFTDVSAYTGSIPEVTNISVGYQDNHRGTETLDAAWLIGRLVPRLYQIDWESLPVERDPAEAMRWHPSIFGNWEFDDTWPLASHGCMCDFCGEAPRRLYEVDLGDGCPYLLCEYCRDTFCIEHGMDWEPMREERQLLFAV